MKRILKLLSIAICAYIMIPLFLPVSASVVWSDDFNDGNLDGWTTFGVIWSGESATEVPANYSLEDNNLRYTGEFSTYTYHASTASSGHWSFDVDCVDNEDHHFYIAFISDGVLDPDDVPDSVPAEYGLMIITGPLADSNPEFRLYRRMAGSTGLGQTIGSYSASTSSGWYHIDISRVEPGDFDIYINGTHRFDGRSITPVTSAYFAFYGSAGPAIDNVVVDDEPIPDPTTTTNGPLLSDMMLIILVVGAAIAVVVIVIVVMKRRK